MNTHFRNSQFVMTFLIGAILGLVGALFVAGFVFEVFYRPFSNQVIILMALWLCLGIVSYLVIARLAKRWAGLRDMLTIENRFGLVYRKIFLAVFFIFPMGIIFYVQFAEVINIPVYASYMQSIGQLSLKAIYKQLLLSMMSLVWCFSIVIGLVSFAMAKWKKMPDIVYILVILAATVFMRAILMTTIKTLPFSDFALINENAIRIAQGDSLKNIFAGTYIFIIMIFGYLYNIFGVNLTVVYVFNMVCYVLAGVFMYYVGKEVFQSQFWGGLAGFLLIAWPSLIFYSNVLTPEHLFILVESAMLYLLVLFFKRVDGLENGLGEKTGWKRYLPWYLAFGLLLGLLSLLRPFSQLYLLAFIITLIVYYKWTPKNSMWRVLGVLMLLTLVVFIDSLPEKIAEHYHVQFTHARYCNLLVGMNFDIAGSYNLEDRLLCVQLQKNIPDESQLAKAFLSLVWQRIIDGRSLFAVLLEKKFTILWANSTNIFFWAIARVSQGDRNAIRNLTARINFIDYGIMFTATTFNLVGVMIAFFKKDVKPVIFFSMLAFFGFNLMEVALEVQTRYRTVVMPLFIFFFVWTLATLARLVGERIFRKKIRA